MHDTPFTIEHTAETLSTLERLYREIELSAQRELQMRMDFAEIYKICFIPTSPGMKAYTHFQRDFDAIRNICSKYTPCTESTSTSKRVPSDGP